MKVPDIDTSNIQEILNIVKRLDDGDFYTLRKMTHSEIRNTFEDALVDIEKLQDFVEVLNDEGICESCEENTGGFMLGQSINAIDGNYCAECASNKRG